MVDEECAPYEGKTKGTTCGQFKSCKPLAKILSTKYVGGGWGEVSEKQIMKELLRNGPLSVEFQANKLFQVYKEGILSEEGAPSGATSLQELASQLTAQSQGGQSSPDQSTDAIE